MSQTPADPASCEDSARLVIVALDGADEDLMKRWAAEGRLPNLSALMARGVFGGIAGPDHEIEHSLHATLWSGRSCGEHGYFYFRQLEPGSYRLRAVSGRDFDIAPFWAQRPETKVAIIDAPETAPVPGLAGVQLCDWATHEPAHPAAANDPEVLRIAQDVSGRREIFPQSPANGPAQNRALLSRYLSRIARKGKLVRRLLASDRFELVVVGFSETHTGGHQFWDYIDQAERYGELGNGVRSIYEAIDRELGEILAQPGLESANVVVIGTVGLSPSFPTDIVTETALVRLGYTTMRASPKGLRPIDMARRLIPQAWRKAISGRFPRALQEQLLADRLESCVDWPRTTAFTIPATHGGFVRVNLKGREPQGTVEPGDACEALLDGIEGDLRQLTDVEDGLPVVQEVLRRDRMYGRDASPDLPDMVVRYRPASRFFARVRHSGAEWDVPRPNWFRSSFHSNRGWYTAAGADLSPWRDGEALGLTDFAPRFLALLDQDRKQPERAARRGMDCGA